MKPITIACLAVLNGILVCQAYAQINSPHQQFEMDVRSRYQQEFTRNELDRFLSDLPWSLEQKRRAEQLLGGNAIRMSLTFGNYAGLLRLPDGELPGIANRMLRVLNGEFRKFWESVTPDTRKLLFENPDYLVSLLGILDKMAASPDSLSYKQFLAQYPDAAVFVDRFPSLLTVDRERLPILLHFLKHISLATNHADVHTKLDQQLRDWHRLLIPLYVATSDEYGPAAAMTLLSIPELFSNRPGVALSEDLRRNQYIWSMLLSQFGFIQERREKSLDWQKDVEDITSLLNRVPSDTRLSPAEWMEFFLYTAPANGKALRLIWELREDGAELRTVDEFLLHLRDQGIPFAITLDLIKFARNSRDLLFLINFIQSPVYGEENRAMYPLVVMSDLTPDRDDNFIRMLKCHEHKLIAYLSDPVYGKSITDRWALALRTDLKDYTYDESLLRKTLRHIPGGNLVNVGLKAFQGYPISGLEATMATIDVGRAVLFVATMGGSEVAAQAGTQVGVEAGTQIGNTAAQKAADATIQAVADKLTEEVAERSMSKFLQSALETACAFIAEHEETIRAAINFAEDAAKDIHQINGYFKSETNKTEFRRREQELFISERGKYLREHKDALIFNRFSGLPLTSQKDAQRTLMASPTATIFVQLPNTHKTWAECIARRTKLNSILLVTLGDLK